MENLEFKEWLEQPGEQPPELTDIEIANLYFHHNNMKVREIASKTQKSIGEVYRILRRYGNPNRQISNHENVHSFAQSGLSVSKIAEFTGYTPRNIRYILKSKDQNAL